MNEVLVASVLTGGLLSFACVVAHLYIEPARWWSCLLPRGASWLRCRDVFLTTAASTYLLPFKLGIPLRLVLIGRFCDLSRLTTIGLMATDSALVLSIWVSVVMVAGGHAVFSLLPKLPTLLVVLAAAAVVCLAWLARKRITIVRSRLFALSEVLRNEPQRIYRALFLVVIDVLSYGVRHIGLALLVGLTWDAALNWFAMGIVATFIGMASGLPLGLLGYDATLLAMSLHAGARSDQALWAITVNRALTMGAAFILGLPAAHRLGFIGGVRRVIGKLRELTRE